MYRVTTDVVANALLHLPVLAEFAAKSVEEVALYFIEPGFAFHTIISGTRDMTGIVVESDSEVFEHNPQTLSKSSFKRLSDMRSEIG